MMRSCPNVLKCNHLCGGVKGEKRCLRCLKEECVNNKNNNNNNEGEGVTYDDYCNICWTEDLASAPSIELDCGHIFHYTCIKQRIDAGSNCSFSYFFIICLFIFLLLS